MERPRPTTEDLPEHISGEFVQNDGGRFFLHNESLDKEALHGRYALACCLELSAEDIRTLGAGRDIERPEKSVVFLDTETTGLAGGTGTYAFLVGLGYWEEEKFVIEQYFMTDYDEELAMLIALGEKAKEFSGLVTYNGRTFDMPLLRSRFRMNRLPSTFDDLPHLDLLPASRRLWRRSLESCSLSVVEKEILGLRRSGDVPGAVIPSIYFEYVRKKSPDRLKPVFYHNAQDIISLALLTWRTARVFRCPLEESLSGMELLSAGRWKELLNDNETAVKCYESVRERCPGSAAAREARHFLAILYKRLGNWESAQPLWRQAFEDAKGPKVYRLVRDWVIFLEHKEKDYRQAMEVVREALDRLQFQKQVSREERTEGLSSILRYQEDFQYRLERLLRKQARRKAQRQKRFRAKPGSE